MFCVFAEFTTISIIKAAYVTREFNNSYLHSQAQAVIRYIILTGKAYSADFPLSVAALAKAARYKNPLHIAQLDSHVFIVQ